MRAVTGCLGAGRLPGQYRLLREVAGYAKVGSDGWCTLQLWCYLAALFSAGMAGTLDASTVL